MSVIDKPDTKGAGCQFCRKCFRLDTNVVFAMTAPPNMPDYTLGASGQVCWPLAVSPEGEGRGEVLEVYPNPVSEMLNVKCSMRNAKKELYNSVGQLIFTTKENEIDVRNYPRGVYFLKCLSDDPSEGSAVRKIIVE